MHNKNKDLNNLRTNILSCLAIFSAFQISVAQTDNIGQVSQDTAPPMRKLIDGVVAVVGDFIILESDVDKSILDLKNQGVSMSEVNRCQIMGSLLENKLYNHHAIQDSLPISNQQIDQQVEQQIAFMKQQIGSEEKVLEFYRKESIIDLKSQLFEIGKSQQLSSSMQQKVLEAVTITPDEVKQFFKAIPKDERPIINTEVEISQIVIKPKPDQGEVDRVINRLNQFREDVLNGSSFATKAVLYSQDPGSRSNGGKYVISRTDPFAKEFKQVAFSLQEGEVSKPFKTDFGYHIVTVDKIMGQKIQLRHVLLIPEVSSSDLTKFKQTTEDLRQKIVSGELTFSEAAITYSDEKETKHDGGILLNPVTSDRRFELSKLDPSLYTQVAHLEEGEVSPVITDQERTGAKYYKIMTVTKKIAEHEANFAKDYTKIKELALNKKKLVAIEKWQNKKIQETYVKINEPYADCEYNNNWLKK